MCDPTTIIAAGAGLIGSLTSAAATGANMANISAMNQAQQQNFAAQKAQSELQLQQQQRQVLRNAAMARSSALSNSVNQGGGASSSGVLGGMGAINTNAGVQTNALTQSGTNMSNIFTAEGNYASASAAFQQTAAIGALGNSLVGMSQPLGQIGGTLFGRANPSGGFGSSWTAISV